MGTSTQQAEDKKVTQEDNSSTPADRPATGDVVAQWVERRPRDRMDSIIRGSSPVRSTRNISASFSE